MVRCEKLLTAMHFRELAEITHSVEATIEFLRESGILHRTPPNCPACGRSMTEVKDNEKNDGRVWRCPTHKSEKRSIRRNSFLENARVKLDDFVILTYLWAANATVKLTAEVTELSKPTVIDWFNFLRDVCTNWMRDHPPIVGGIGHVVEIDESVVSKAKYNRGRRVPERWIFGGYDTTTKLGFLHEVDDRSASTLLPLIKKYILPGTTIHSDSWPSYRRVRHIGAPN